MSQRKLTKSEAQAKGAKLKQRGIPADIADSLEGKTERQAVRDIIAHLRSKRRDVQ